MKLPNRQSIFDLLFLICYLTIFFALWLGSYALFTPDEARYCEIAREMWVTGNYITPHLNGVIFLDKPILYYWLQVLSIKWFGLHEWSLRLWPALLSILGCLWIYITGRQLFDRRTGLFAAIILATSPLYYVMGHYASMDSEVAVFINSSLLAFLVGITINERRYFLWLAYIFAALAILTKGMIGLAFPIIIIGLWILVLNKWHLLLQMRLIPGLIIIALIVLPWFILVQQANPDFLQYFFIKQQVSRFLTNSFNDQSPIWFYVPVVAIGFFPWILFLPQAVWQTLTAVWRNRQQYQVELFLLIWPLVILVFFSIPTSKTIGYITPIITPLALLVSKYLNNSKAKTGYIIYIISAVILSAGLLIAPYYTHNLYPASTVPYFYSFSAILLLSTILIVFHFTDRKRVKRFVILTLTMGIILLALVRLNQHVNTKSIKPLALIINQYASPANQVVAYFIYYYDLPVYTQRRITIVASWDTPEIINGDTWQHQLANGKRTAISKQWLIDASDFWQQWHSSQRLLVLVDADLMTNFAKAAGDSLHIIAQHGHTFLVTNQPLPNTQTLLSTKVTVGNMSMTKSKEMK